MRINNCVGYLFTGDYGGRFDSDYNPKLAYFAVADPEGYLAGNYDTKAKRDKWVKALSESSYITTLKQQRFLEMP